ncbi:ETC complex I subunit conserved region-domain-containing protein [Zychaea mexicana]|uniref:ETC complex I subunit conserved region-domain-containing protein n=1 Tax=Zychaea mexicana TaxID=64656 RepID=UPI0022FF2017|nr:ETC complex I subunit conserved region-domain-containing protein [Zychaea mexicana]KAI9492914.1 ETC complex I subunit conserved region-domain-containing protein [Zychaea mexicana]
MLRSITAAQTTCTRPLTTAALRSFSTTRAAMVNDKDKEAEIAKAEENRALHPLDAISGAPEELLDRTVRIFSPSKPATQSGKFGTRHWRIDFDILPEGNRWENPLIGWASSADYQQGLSIKFSTKDDAIAFAERQGWNYYVQEPKKVKFAKKSYADNYKYVPGQLRLIKTK